MGGGGRRSAAVSGRVVVRYTCAVPLGPGFGVASYLSRVAESTAAYFLRAPAIASPAYTVANTRKTAPTPDVSRVKSTMAMTMNYRAATAAIVTGDVTLRVIGRVLGDRTSLTRSGSPFMRPSPHAGLLRHGG